ncbi:MAG: hypothetical protein JO015_01955 [Verrucomicrobia bacterium]|nr:hypothetical protein [Verrucomicrobiota bacterium]
MLAQTLRAAVIVIGAGTLMAGCSTNATDDIPSASDSALSGGTPQPAPQLPESMKSGTVSGDTNDQPVFRGSL